MKRVAFILAVIWGLIAVRSGIEAYVVLVSFIFIGWLCRLAIKE